VFTLVRGGGGSFLIVFLVYSFPRSSKYCHNLTINQCSNVTFLGKGADKTLISGGVDISDQKNIVFKGIHVNNGVTVSGKETSGFFSGCFFSGCALDGLSVDDFASVTATQCHFFDNEWSGADLNNHSKGAFTNCTFYENGEDEGAGVAAKCGAVVNIYGRNTAIYSNPGDGIFVQANAVVDIYLPFEHNTVHDNGRKGFHCVNTNTNIIFKHTLFS
jgi:hypothetical protein